MSNYPGANLGLYGLPPMMRAAAAASNFGSLAGNFGLPGFGAANSLAAAAAAAAGAPTSEAEAMAKLWSPFLNAAQTNASTAALSSSISTLTGSSSAMSSSTGSSGAHPSPPNNAATNPFGAHFNPQFPLFSPLGFHPFDFGQAMRLGQQTPGQSLAGSSTGSLSQPSLGSSPLSSAPSTTGSVLDRLNVHTPTHSSSTMGTLSTQSSPPNPTPPTTASSAASPASHSTASSVAPSTPTSSNNSASSSIMPTFDARAVLSAYMNGADSLSAQPTPLVCPTDLSPPESNPNLSNGSIPVSSANPPVNPFAAAAASNFSLDMLTQQAERYKAAAAACFGHRFFPYNFTKPFVLGNNASTATNSLNVNGANVPTSSSNLNNAASNAAAPSSFNGFGNFGANFSANPFAFGLNFGGTADKASFPLGFGGLNALNFNQLTGNLNNGLGSMGSAPMPGATMANGPMVGLTNGKLSDHCSDPPTPRAPSTPLSASPITAEMGGGSPCKPDHSDDLIHSESRLADRLDPLDGDKNSRSGSPQHAQLKSIEQMVEGLQQNSNSSAGSNSSSHPSMLSAGSGGVSGSTLLSGQLPLTSATPSAVAAGVVQTAS
jgi:hypothetical protein